jgi:hypothetical protein
MFFDSKKDRNALKTGLEMIKSGFSVEKTSKVCGVPASTLRSKLKNNNDNFYKSGAPPVLSREEENDIVNWILLMEHWGCPRTRKDVLIQVSK